MLLPPGRHRCFAAVFKHDYEPCSNGAIKKRGRWQLCASHVRLDELEVVVDNIPEMVVD